MCHFNIRPLVSNVQFHCYPTSHPSRITCSSRRRADHRLSHAGGNPVKVMVPPLHSVLSCHLSARLPVTCTPFKNVVANRHSVKILFTHQIVSEPLLLAPLEPRYTLLLLRPP
ncbi:hypothetical protein E2C01_007934 [Portunus trituberculatus]|uniref:Uncharacterized protein n=1 Tax=Portunus trituberculatus TaxID=210409 RepID=A0A5B7D0A2_PORTR|nr:hypothetical protein [Portunus trituberculatus]